MSETKPVLKRVGPWLCHTSETVYDNPWISVRHETVTTPGGTDGIYGVIHFKSQAVGVVPIDDQGNTYLVRQTRYTLNESSWEIPEGGSPIGEDPLDTAKRELQEEVGLVASQWQTLNKIHTSNSVTDEQGYIYLAQGLSEVAMAHEDTEDIEVLKLPFDQAVQMVLDGEITDCISMAALLRVKLMLGG